MMENKLCIENVSKVFLSENRFAPPASLKHHLRIGQRCFDARLFHGRDGIAGQDQPAHSVQHVNVVRKFCDPVRIEVFQVEKRQVQEIIGEAADKITAETKIRQMKVVCDGWWYRVDLIMPQTQKLKLIPAMQQRLGNACKQVPVRTEFP